MLRTSTPPRGPRGSSPNIRGVSRGGIQKRRHEGPTKVDKDGDLVMDAAAADKSKSGKGRIGGSTTNKPSGPRRSTGGPQRGGSHKSQSIIRGMDKAGQHANIIESRITMEGTTLQVDGLSASKAASNADGGLESLLAFLERKASGLDPKSNKTIKIKKSSIRDGSVIITASPEDIAEIQKLDNFQFAGTILSIKPCAPPSPLRGKAGDKKSKDEGVSKGAQEVKDKLRAILAGRYDVDLKLLNLSALSLDDGLRGMGLFDGTTNTSKVFPALMAVCDGLFKTRQEKRDAIASVSLADNGLSNVSEVNALAQTFPDLKNLDLSRNQIVDLKGIEVWRRRFRLLENLLLNGNPIDAQLPNLKDDILQRYPNLQILNGVQVRTPDEVIAARAIAGAPVMPFPISGADFRDVGQVGETFIRQFLSLYDTNRNALLTMYYDSTSVHSISINNSAPRNSEHILPVAPWTAYTKHSRNLNKITHLTARMNRQVKGTQAIQSLWSSLPATRHPDLQTQANKYMIECRPLPGLPDPSGQVPQGVDGLLITIHGEFEDQDPLDSSSEKSLRSFSRTFILGPGGPTSPAIRVISDAMVLRAWSPLEQPQISSTTQVSQPIINSEQQQQEVLAMQLTEKTGMTIAYSVLCLTETGWDLEKAYSAFVANKANLPPDAFVSGVIAN